jgi:hypothetical protein
MICLKYYIDIKYDTEKCGETYSRLMGRVEKLSRQNGKSQGLFFKARSENCEKQLLALSCMFVSVRPSVRQHGKPQLPLEGFYAIF